MFEFFWNFLFFALAISILVAVHEFGHFYIARLCKVKVLKFSIGFGKEILSYKAKKTKTVFSFSLIPLGGYVKMLDTREANVRPKDYKYAFDKQRRLKRFAIVLAGPLFNFIFAIFALFLVYSQGITQLKPMISSIDENNHISKDLANHAPFLVTKINDKEIKSLSDLNYKLAQNIGKQEIKIDLVTKNNLEKSVNLYISNWKFSQDDESLLKSIGLLNIAPTATNRINHVVKNLSAFDAGVQKGDELLSLAGKKIENFAQFSNKIKNSPKQNLELEVLRANEKIKLKLYVGTKNVNNQEVGFVGVSPEFLKIDDEYLIEQKFNLIDSTILSLTKTYELIKISFILIGKLFTLDISLDNLSGPISIAKGAGQSAGGGLTYFFAFLALISVNLGVINLLPFPVLDGGHLMLYTIEAIRGKPLGEKTQDTLFKLGSIFLFALMFIAITNDISRL